MTKDKCIENADRVIEIGKELGAMAAKLGLHFNRKLASCEKEVVKKQIDEDVDAAEIFTKILARFTTRLQSDKMK